MPQVTGPPERSRSRWKDKVIWNLNISATLKHFYICDEEYAYYIKAANFLSIYVKVFVTVIFYK
jgi:hypothetical protein